MTAMPGMSAPKEPDSDGPAAGRSPAGPGGTRAISSQTLSELPPNVVPLRPRQVSATAANPPVTGEVASAKPTPIFGTATIHLPEWPLVLVLTSVVLSMMVLVLDSFRRGALALAASLVLAFFLRLVLNDRDAGMLKVRNRKVDLLTLGCFATALMIFAIWVPAPS